ncbi:hypothetical protein BD410DRAFT_110328 [Rickenella mellea]|uniref:SET domain-containing protein n=1 Tax=Rickenella mellea TaxID=50990 RepID=A0A4Y7QBG1_9AGAM|nr:hypothetical protein BD410DRAFT_110328 [Rickenella mellea]
MPPAIRIPRFVDRPTVLTSYPSGISKFRRRLPLYNRFNMLCMTARATSNSSSHTNRTELPQFGWPIQEKPVPRLPTTPQEVDAALDSLAAGGRLSIFGRACRESFQSTNKFCLWITYDHPFDGEYSDYGWGPPPESPTPPPFSIQPVSGCGRGMVASRSIKAGETIVVERPLAMHPAVIPEIDHLQGRWGLLEHTYEDSFHGLGEREKSLYMDLWNCKPLSGTLGNRLLGIARTNALHSIFSRFEHLPHYAGVYPNISRCNHSCGPNAAATRFDDEKMAMTLAARRSIAPGEEITISYTVEWTARSPPRRIEDEIFIHLRMQTLQTHETIPI